MHLLNRSLVLLTLLLAPVALLPACGDGDAASGSDRDALDSDDGAEGGACMFSSDCAPDLVCIAFGALGGVCTPQCSASADDCGAMASCSGVGAIEVNICQDDPDPAAPPQPEEEPKLPCMTDADCDALAAGAICVEWKASATAPSRARRSQPATSRAPARSLSTS